MTCLRMYTIHECVCMYVLWSTLIFGCLLRPFQDHLFSEEIRLYKSHILPVNHDLKWAIVRVRKIFARASLISQNRVERLIIFRSQPLEVTFFLHLFNCAMLSWYWRFLRRCLGRFWQQLLMVFYHVFTQFMSQPNWLPLVSFTAGIHNVGHGVAPDAYG